MQIRLLDHFFVTKKLIFCVLILCSDATKQVGHLTRFLLSILPLPYFHKSISIIVNPFSRFPLLYFPQNLLSLLSFHAAKTYYLLINKSKRRCSKIHLFHRFFSYSIFLAAFCPYSVFLPNFIHFSLLLRCLSSRLMTQHQFDQTFTIL